MPELALTYEASPMLRPDNLAFSQGLPEGFARLSSFGGTLATWSKPNWQLETEAKINQLLRLPRGWDGYGSEPISQSVARFALDALSSAATAFMSAPSVVPVAGGGLQMEWHEGGVDIELCIPRPYQAELYVAFLDGRPPIELELGTDYTALTMALQEIG